MRSHNEVALFYEIQLYLQLLKIKIVKCDLYGSEIGGVHKLRLQEDVGRWSKNIHFLLTFIP